VQDARLFQVFFVDFEREDHELRISMEMRFKEELDGPHAREDKYGMKKVPSILENKKQNKKNSLPRCERFAGAARGCDAEGRDMTRRAADAARTAGRASVREKAESVAMVGGEVRVGRWR
jgi:hypothetical protein